MRSSRLDIPALIGTALLAAALTAPAFAEMTKPIKAATVPDAVRAAITASVQHSLNLTPESITPSGIPGLYEVYAQGHMSYIDATGTYLLDGPLALLATKENLTEKRLDVLNGANADIAALPIKDAIKIVKGNGSRTMYVFEDANCGYCKRLEADNVNLTNITEYIFPVAFLGDDSAEKGRAVWCSKDRGKAWSQVMEGQAIAPAAATCDGAVLQRNAELAKTLHVTGTPTMFMAGGARIRGYVAADVLEKVLK